MYHIITDFHFLMYEFLKVKIKLGAQRNVTACEFWGNAPLAPMKEEKRSKAEEMPTLKDFLNVAVKAVICISRVL